MTKTPQSERTRLCLRLLAGLIGSGGSASSAGSADVVVYLAGDGVYNLILPDGQDCAGHAGSRLDKTLPALLTGDRIVACREDLLARGISTEGNATATIPANFYELLVNDMMKEGSRIYTF